jgi:ATP-dependent Clp protease ATP-binding subunit ClpB
MTSNAGSEFIVDQASDDDIRRRVEGVLATTFRPEFLNRVDETVIFRRLTAEQIRSIVDLQLARLASRLADRKIDLDVSGEARDLLGREGYDPAFGARPLKRVVQRRLENPLALALLEGRIADGDRVVVETDGDELTFAPAPVEPVALEA